MELRRSNININNAIRRIPYQLALLVVTLPLEVWVSSDPMIPVLQYATLGFLNSLPVITGIDEVIVLDAVFVFHFLF